MPRCTPGLPVAADPRDINGQHGCPQRPGICGPVSVSAGPPVARGTWPRALADLRLRPGYGDVQRVGQFPAVAGADRPLGAAPNGNNRTLKVSELNLNALSAPRHAAVFWRSSLSTSWARTGGLSSGTPHARFQTAFYNIWYCPDQHKICAVLVVTHIIDQHSRPGA